MDELEQETSQDPETTELQVLWLLQLPGTADRPALSHGKAEVEFLFQKLRL